MAEDRFNVPLEKSELVKILQDYNADLDKKYEAGEIHYFTYAFSIINPGVPQMLLTALTKVSGRKQGDLKVSDLVSMFEAIRNFSHPNEEIGYLKLKKFSKTQGLFFGGSQYIIGTRYLESLS